MRLNPRLFRLVGLALLANAMRAAAPAELAAALAASKPDVILTTADGVVRVVLPYAKDIPVVFTISSDPIGIGAAASLARPGGNATGFTNMARELSAKRLQLLKEAVPRITHAGVLFQPDANGMPQLKEIETAAARLKMRVTPLALKGASDIEPAFKSAASVEIGREHV